MVKESNHITYVINKPHVFLFIKKIGGHCVWTIMSACVCDIVIPYQDLYTLWNIQRGKLNIEIAAWTWNYIWWLWLFSFPFICDRCIFNLCIICTRCRKTLALYAVEILCLLSRTISRFRIWFYRETQMHFSTLGNLTPRGPVIIMNPNTML